MCAPRTRIVVVLCVGLAVGLGVACKKKQEAPKGNPAPAQPAPPPGMDTAAAVKALIPNVWTGVLQGKPLKLYVITVRDTPIAVMRFGETRSGGRLTLSPQGKFTIASRPRPTDKGLETVRFHLQLKPDFSALVGSAERSSKQGFVEQSSGLGDFALAKGPALKGAIILSPQPKGSFGAAVGLKLWDEIIELDGKKVSPGETVKTPDKVGQEVKLVVLRNGERVELEGQVPPPMKPAPPGAKTAQPAKKPAAKADE